MREAASYTESMGADSANTLLYPPNESDQDGHSITDLIQPHSDSVRTLVVTAEQSVEDWLSSNQDVKELSEELIVVSVGDGARSTTAAAQSGSTTAPTPGPLPGEPVIEFVSDAGSLSELGQTINANLSKTPAHESEHAQIVYLDSVSSLLDASDIETVFRFLHMLTSLVDARGATAYYQLDPSQVDSEAVSILLPLFGSKIE